MYLPTGAALSSGITSDNFVVREERRPASGTILLAPRLHHGKFIIGRGLQDL
jgi:hypothetical protein